jgi:cytochrome c
MKVPLFILVLSCSIFVFAADFQQTAEGKKLSELVDKAADLVSREGAKAFSELRQQNGNWWKGELYIFVDGMDGTVLVHPPDPKLEGQNLLQDPASKAVMKLLIDTAKTKGSGWVEYMWPKPGETIRSKKMSYIRKVKMPDGTFVIVGAGTYVK